MAPSSLDPDFLGGRLGREPSEPFGEFIAVAHSSSHDLGNLLRLRHHKNQRLQI